MDITKDIKRIIDQSGKKVHIYFSVKSIGDDYDPREKNYTFANLNPKCIKAYVSTLSADKLVWKQYGLTETGAVELVTLAKYKDWFKHCNRVVIDGEDYSVFRVGADNRVLVYDRPGGLIRVTLERKG